MNAQLLTELVLGGIILGGLYALMAFAFSLVLATTHVLNVAHGTFMVLGAALSTLLVRHLHLQLGAGLGAVFATFLVAGWIFQAGVVRPLAGRPPTQVLVGSILATFGLAIGVEALLGFFWARAIEPQPIFALQLGLSSIRVGSVVVSGPRALVLLFSVVAVGLFHLFLTRTRLGLQARAVAQNPTGALVIGIEPSRVARTVLTLSVAAAALAGAFLVIAIPLTPYDGLRLTMVAFSVAAAAGIGNLPGCLWAGVGLGIAEVLTGYWAGPVWSPVTYLVVLFVALLARPTELLGRLPR